MGRRGLLVAVWVAGTVTATALASAAVRQVTAEVGPEPPLPVPSEVALAPQAELGPQSDAAPPGDATATPPRAASSERPRPGAAGAGQNEPGEEQGDGAADAPGDAQDPAPANDAGEPPTGEQEPAEQQAPATTESYSLRGGVVTIRYADGAARLVGASPASGFTAEVNDAGPPRVDVRFRSDDHESRLRAEWDNGRPDVRREEDDR